MNKITIFTPTYNRVKYLKQAYESLKSQTNKNFTWLIVDDGSTDDTEITVEKWKNEKKIGIIYAKQENKGKHVAHNKAMKLCETEFLMCLDSDDYLEKNMIEYLYENINKYDLKQIWGIVGPKKEEKQEKILWPHNVIQTKFAYLYERYKYKGETYLLLNVSLIKENELEFPYFKNEKIVLENVLYDALDTKYDIILCDKPLYIFQYLEGGYTKSGIKLLMNNVNGFAYANYSRAFKSKYSFFTKILSFSRYLAMKFVFKGETFNEYKGKWILKILGYVGSVIFILNYILKVKK